MRATRIVIVNYRTPDLAVNCLRSLADEVRAEPHCRATIVDNASADGSAERIVAAIRRERWDWAELLPLNRNGGFSAGNNAAIRPLLRGPDAPEYFLLLNPDTIVRPGAITTLVDFMEAHPRAGVVGSRLELPDGTPQTSAFRFHNLLSQFDYGFRLGWLSQKVRQFLAPMPIRDEPHRADWVSGASLIVRREVFERVGVLDEEYFLYFEETDFCLRARRAGWECWHVPASRVVHLEGQSTGVIDGSREKKRMPRYWFESRRRFFRKNYGWVYGLLASAVLASGFAAWRVRRRLQGKPDTDPPGFLWDLVRYSFL
jgi:GT2 family glycosyltransferase